MSNLVILLLAAEKFDATRLSTALKCSNIGYCQRHFTCPLIHAHSKFHTHIKEIPVNIVQLLFAIKLEEMKHAENRGEKPENEKFQLVMC